MDVNLGQHLTLLGICTLVFCGVTGVLGTLSAGILPAFFVSALIFLSAGRCMGRAARVRVPIHRRRSGRR
ncbi:MAG: hypothetical protein C0617_08200 [Desulfuromonas sp.]|uniref:hypothetical protein n=1 Tax=Desulfuromonas sp. TaxID=892 RepID=UPI000CB897A7|nr:hypothetical protein [Desulfuromonas sp.]PLX84352.1 MAG: hypothetical protein C0617_08200 [Desulfuromonas sp.]